MLKQKKRNYQHCETDCIRFSAGAVTRRIRRDALPRSPSSARQRRGTCRSRCLFERILLHIEERQVDLLLAIFARLRRPSPVSTARYACGNAASSVRRR